MTTPKPRLFNGLRTALITLLVLIAMTMTTKAQTIYVMDSGDTVRVTVFGEPDLSGEFKVDAMGRLNLALIGPVSVRNLTTDQARQKIHNAYLDGYLRHPDIAVEIIAFRPFFIMGKSISQDPMIMCPA